MIIKLDEIEKRIYYFIKKYEIYKNGDKVLIAVSGGKDSMSLIYILRNISKILNLEISVAHFNHKLRKEADDEELLVRDTCNELNIKYYSSFHNVKEYAESEKLSLEDAARKLRYNFLFETLEKIGYDKLATAHHETDLTENILYRMTRGSGIYGLGGLMPVNEKLTRPLLTVTCKEIAKYVTIHNVKYLNDKSNFETIYSRNKIRHNVLPHLEAINNEFENNFFKLSEIIWDYRKYIESLYDLRVKSSKNNSSFELSIFNDIFDAELLRIIFLKCGKYPPNHEETLKIIKMRSGKTRELCGIIMLRKQDKLLFDVRGGNVIE